MTSPLEHLDSQLRPYRAFYAKAFAIPESAAWLQAPASSVHADVTALPTAALSAVAAASRVPLSERINELVAFNAWMDFMEFAAAEGGAHPTLVRAQVQTQLYVCFAYLRDTLVAPIRDALVKASHSRRAFEALTQDPVRALRNAVAHGNWRYAPDFTALVIFDKPRADGTSEWTIPQADLTAWQALSRGISYAALEAVRERLR